MRVLIVAYYFPPVGGIGSIRLSRFAELLPEFGWDAHVLTAKGTPHRHDDELRFDETLVTRALSIEPSRAVGALGSRAARGGGAPRGTEGLRGKLRTGVLRRIYPDPQIGWYPGAVRSGQRLLRAMRFDAIYSSSYPLTAHLVARTLQSASGVPWVAEFRDPSEFVLPADNLHRGRAAELEAGLARRAQMALVPSPAWAEHYAARWRREVGVLPNGFDPMPPPAPPSDELVLTHVGSYYPERQSLGPLWRRLRESGAGNIRVRFVGDLSAAARAELDAAGLGGSVEHVGAVSHSAATRIAANSSMLVAAGSADADPIGRGWVPAKLFEYLASGLPILFIGARESDAGRLIAAHPGGFVVEQDDSEGLRAALEAAARGTTYQRELTSLTRRARTEELATRLTQVAGAADAGTAPR